MNPTGQDFPLGRLSSPLVSSLFEEFSALTAFSPSSAWPSRVSSPPKLPQGAQNPSPVALVHALHVRRSSIQTARRATAPIQLIQQERERAKVRLGQGQGGTAQEKTQKIIENQQEKIPDAQLSGPFFIPYAMPVAVPVALSLPGWSAEAQKPAPPEVPEPLVIDSPPQPPSGRVSPSALALDNSLLFSSLQAVERENARLREALEKSRGAREKKKAEEKTQENRKSSNSGRNKEKVRKTTISRIVIEQPASEDSAAVPVVSVSLSELLD